MKLEGKICLITFSNNVDHQNVVYSMYWALQEKADVYTIGIIDPKSPIAPKTRKNYYYNCPLRPGIESKTFRIDILLKIAQVIRENGIKYLYFESLHVWNAALMLLCPKCIRIEAIHDVIPHDGNRAMDLANYVTGKLADHIILRNTKYKQDLSKRFKIKEDKISCLQPWRDFPERSSSNHTGVYLYFGRIRRYKGFDKLVEIIKETPDISYRIVGEPDEESIPLVNELVNLENADVEPREVSDDQMIEEFRRADWIILPYKEATQSGVILDAYRFSRPVIAFNVGAISEQIENGLSGFLVPEGDVDEFIRIIKHTSKMSAQEHEKFCQDSYVYGFSKYS